MGGRNLQQDEKTKGIYFIFIYQVGCDSFSYVIDQHIYKTWLPHKQLGLCYYQLGNYGESYRHNLRVLEYLPNDLDTFNNLNVLEPFYNGQMNEKPSGHVSDES
ncbi:tetratricopeptide repeat protein [Bacillus cereus]|uniref:tetratricopeptide repeat protein n=1 Tax=Bacillus cereus TaxID=1396 RepID=UPI000BEBC511|nr:hypothetical protein [Bacillus cereus]PEF69513.1 hypothetical protein CON35_08075 [Bacillus cereus]